MKKKSHITIISNTAKDRRASVRMLMPLDGVFSVRGKPVPQETLAAVFSANAAELSEEQIAVRSNFFDTEVKVDTRGPNFNSAADVVPNEDTDYIYPLFRALSASIIPGYWVEYPADVLKKSVPLLEGRTVYKNHDRFDCEKWVGAVNQSVWDAEGTQSENVPGVNAEFKIDLKVAPLIARGIVMKPPAINAVSVTVVFTFDYSHPDIEKESHWKFMDLLGEEVGGQIVRFIATEILDYQEISVVSRGADRLARGVNPDDEEEDDNELSERSNSAPPLNQPPTQPSANQSTNPGATAPTAKEKQTVKLSAEQKKKLGLEALEGDEVDDSVVMRAVEQLSARAEAGDVLVSSARAECLRVATLAEVGADEGVQLPATVADIINDAPAGRLDGLTKMYSEKAAQRFKPTCQKCGSQDVATRSSVETPPAETVSQQEPVYSSADALFS
jgi:hypothetical protein